MVSRHDHVKGFFLGVPIRISQGIDTTPFTKNRNVKDLEYQPPKIPRGFESVIDETGDPIIKLFKS